MTGAELGPIQGLNHRSGGNGDNHLVLLHGLGATGEVWDPLIACIEKAPGWRWTAPDLRGHGRSPWATPYDPEALASDVARLVSLGPEAARLVILGHSLGGVVALALASHRHGVQPAAALALGVKVAWMGDEVARMSALASAAPRIFAARPEATERYLKVSGLWGLSGVDDPMARAGVTRVGGGWRLAMDPRANGVGAPDMARLLGEARCGVHLARGETDPMVTGAQLRGYDSGAADLPGLGHNAMVEEPGRVWDWVRACLA